MDLVPEPCHDHTEEEELCIAIRLTNTDEEPRPQNECSPNLGNENYQCTRIREQVQIKVFSVNGLPENTCAILVDYDGENPTPSSAVDFDALCDCFKKCPDQCCGDGWVLLGSVLRHNCTLNPLDAPKYERQYVKPIRCVCPPPMVPAPAPAPAPAPEAVVRPQPERIQQSALKETTVAETKKTEATKTTSTEKVDTKAAEKPTETKASQAKTTETKATPAKTTTKKTTDKK